MMIRNIQFRNKRLKLLLTPFILLGIILIAMTLTVVFQYRTLEEISQMPFERMLVGFIESLGLVFLYNYIVRKLNVSYPWKRNWLIRSIIDFGVTLIIPIIIIGSINFAINEGWMPKHHEEEQFRLIVFIMPLMVSALLMIVVEMIVATEERNQLEFKLTQLEKEQISTKYTALKEQLDHHFLFNNLSVLSSLIYESTEKADKFIQDFAAIYRYVLSINKQDLVTLKEELDFIRTYLNLYKYRYEEGLNFRVNIDDQLENRLLPPLSLQVVIENVLKHNVVSRQRPLTITIETKTNSLLIKNNIQPKTEKYESTHTGQQNLIEKFKLLHGELPNFTSDGKHYVSQIPLIPPTHD
ncbi:sensor histidine kinase [Carboxylicivirga taeanensis]|uniref:sensor histidine kinase n=1 Tax=Carboxylicivirga taeanensis TaxID=1416875 RepID=UPI003F6DDCE7